MKYVNTESDSKCVYSTGKILNCLANRYKIFADNLKLYACIDKYPSVNASAAVPALQSDIEVLLYLVCFV